MDPHGAASISPEVDCVYEGEDEAEGDEEDQVFYVERGPDEASTEAFVLQFKKSNHCDLILPVLLIL